jgi:hypothetical protein
MTEYGDVYVMQQDLAVMAQHKLLNVKNWS